MELVVVSVVEGDEVAFGVADVVLSGSVDVVFGVVQEFDPMGDPSGNSGDGEEDGVHVGWETHGSVDEAAVEVDVGVEFSGDEVLIFKGDFL